MTLDGRVLAFLTLVAIAVAILLLVAPPPETSLAWVAATVLVLLGAGWFAADLLSSALGRNQSDLPMSANEIVRYVRDESAWAFRQYQKYNFWHFVEDFTVPEVTRAAKAGQLHMTGRRPNSDIREPIDLGHWEFARIDPRNIWTTDQSSTELFRTFEPVEGIQSRFSLAAPRSEVMATWPRASMPFKVFAVSRVWLRSVRIRFVNFLSDLLDGLSS